MAESIKGITIEIDGNTTKFDRAIKDSNKEVNSLNKELKNIDSSLKFNPGNVELLGQKQELLKQKTQAAKEKLEALKAAQADVEKQFANGEIDQGQYNKFQQEVIKAESQVKTFNGQLKETQKELKSVSGLSGVMNKVGDGFEKAGKKMSDLGGKLSKGVTAPIVAIGAAAGAAWKGIDDALDTIVTKTGATGDAVKEFEGNFKNVFTSIPAEAQQVGDAIGELNTQFGLTGEALEQASTQMVQFAAINGTDITNSTIAAKQAMEQFGASTEELPGFLDTVTAAAQQTGQSTDSIFEAVKRGAPQLKAMGLSMNQSALLMAKFQQAGLDSSKTISMLTRAQTNFAKEGKTLKEGMVEFFKTVEQGGDSVDVINQATQIFGKSGATMVENIKAGKISLDDFTASAENYAGTVAETFKETLDPVDALQQVMNNLATLGAELFNTIQEVAAPIIEQLVEKIKSLREKWEELSPQTQQTIVKVAAIAAAIGPLLIVLGKMATGIGAVIKALTLFASPVGIVVALVAGAVALIIANWDKIKKAWEDLKKFLVDTWNAIKSKAEEIWNGIKKFFEDLWNGIKKTVETIWNGIKKFIEGLWNGLKTTAETVWNGVKGFFEGLWNGIKKTVETVWGGIKGFFEDTWNGLKSTAETLWNGVKSAVIDPVKDAAKEVWDKAKDMAEGFIDGVKDLPGKVGGFFKSAYEGIKGWVDKAIDKIRGLKKESDDYSNSPKAYSETGGTTIRGAGPAGGRAAYRSRAFEGLEAIGIDGLNWYDKGGIFKSPTVIGVNFISPAAMKVAA